MKLKILSAIFLFTLSNISYAQQNCSPAKDDEYHQITYATGLNQTKYIQYLTSKFCYDFEGFDYNKLNEAHPIFLSPSPVFLQYFLNTNRNYIDLKDPKFHLDILSYLLISPYKKQPELTETQKNTIISNMKKYYPTASLSLFEDDSETLSNNKDKLLNPTMIKNRNDMINLLSQYYKKLLLLPTDKNGNDVISFAILTNEPTPIINIGDTEFYNFYNLNKDGLSPYHLAFSAKFNINDDDISKKNQRIINDILIKNYSPSKLGFLNINDISYLEFIELMKDNNIELYEKILEKQRTLIPVENIYVDLIKDNKAKFNDLMTGYILDTNQ